MTNRKRANLLLILTLLSVTALCLCGAAALSACRESDSPDPGTGTDKPDTDAGTNTDASSGTDTDTDVAETDPATDGGPDGTEVTPDTDVTDSDTEPATGADVQAGPDTRAFLTGLTVTENGRDALVTTEDGLTYTASGYESFTDGRFVIRDGLTVTFADGTFTDGFTRMRFAYVSTQPLRLFVTYVQDGQQKTDDFYAEAGENLFCCLISDFIRHKTAADISSVRFVPCNGQTALFALCGLDTQLLTLDVGGQKIYYVEGERYKLGLSARWGWTICYISDRRCEIDGVTNLVNMHDSGRLIQQSYYGTTVAQGDFVPGRVNSDVWPYNPVQAGDKADRGSRLIDLVIKDRSVYVKVQPMDWGQTDWYCPAYMENTYTVDGDIIRVDNRYVEFSNYDNPYASQELPAFYTVGYFNEFIWYDGDRGWTDGPLSSETDLEMIWTATEHTGTFDVPVKIGNTETWGALYSRADGYGIGMYVPNTDQLSAMTYEAADPSKNARGVPCAYMKAVREMRLTSYEPLVYSYLITCGSIDEIRSVFKENKDFTDNAGLDRNSVDRRVPGGSMDPREIDCTKPENAVFFSQGHAGSRAVFDTEEQAVRLSSYGEDPYFHIVFTALDRPVLAEDYKGIEIVYRIPETDSPLAGDGFQIFLVCGEDKEARGGKEVNGRYITDGEYHTLFLDFSSVPFWSGRINKLRYDFLNQSEYGDSVIIASVRLVPVD